MVSVTPYSATWRNDIAKLLNSLGTAAFADIVGSIADGAIIERGSNANGEYERFADGTQICWLSSFSMTQNSSSTFRNTWSFPASFISAPTLMPPVFPHGSTSWGGSALHRQNVSCVTYSFTSSPGSQVDYNLWFIAGYTVSPGDSVTDVHIAAKGRWQ